MAEHVKYLDDPDKSENDTKVYKSLVLSAPSVHIGLTSNATCALMVNHGPFADPRNYQCLAHLLQHIIFMRRKPRIPRRTSTANAPLQS